jgi:SAM-dependent methyltransferase
MVESRHLQSSLPGLEESVPGGAFTVTFPRPRARSIPQAAEYCFVEHGGRRRRIRFHDYPRIYAIPGLYEHLFHDRLACQSPALLTRLLEYEVGRAGMAMDELAVLDVGAGNGLMGAELRRTGAGVVVGVDILPEAAQAAQRDRPGVYDAYYVADLLALPPDLRPALERWRCNGLTLVSALSAGHVPAAAFATAYNLICDGGFVVLNLRDRPPERGAPGDFARFVGELLARGRLEELLRVRYVHRLSITGEPLYYTGIVGRKQADIPATRRAPRTSPVPRRRRAATAP